MPKKCRKASVDSDSSLSADYDENLMADYCTVMVSYELACFILYNPCYYEYRSFHTRYRYIQ